MNVTIVDYNCGNLTSLKNALEHLGGKVRVASDPEALKKAEKIILPGVGAFGFGIRNLRERNLVEALTQLKEQGQIPILGICLGAQLMLRESEENADMPGLGWVAGSVKKIKANGTHVRVPHVGWEETRFSRESIFAKTGDKQIFYYTHSYYMNLDRIDEEVARCKYSGGFTSIFSSGNVWGCQFHPEKSQKAGLDFLKTFMSV